MNVNIDSESIRHVTILVEKFLETKNWNIYVFLIILLIAILYFIYKYKKNK